MPARHEACYEHGVKIWANSGDSHLVEPDDLFATSLPPALAERMPRSVKADDGRQRRPSTSTGSRSSRRIPARSRRSPTRRQRARRHERAPGANDVNLRLRDLDQEGVWAELVYPSIGIWMSSIRDPELLAAGCRAINEWAFEFQRRSLRHVPTATIPLLTVEHAVAEVERAADIGFKAAYFAGRAADRRGLERRDVGAAVGGVRGDRPGVGYPHRHRAARRVARTHGAYYRGPGGALLNYVETTYGGQRAATKMIASRRARPPPGAAR